MSKEKDFVKEITSRDEDASQWYVDVIRKAEMADYSPVRGCMVIRPYGYAIWEAMQAGLDRRIKETGHQNAYFPMFIPEGLLKKEADHVEGFAPEVAWVTHGGNEELTERLVVRPTSEAIICSMYAKWVKSWRDLPLLYNQWANVVRWEKVTRLFLRTTEFLWQEGHTVHASAEEAEEETLRMLGIYRRLAEDYLAIPVVTGRKSDSEKFAGAVRTYAIEMLMPDGKALQAGTSHNLGQNFARAFNIRYESKEQKLEYAWQTSWGATTRLVGAVVMTHGDDSGLVLPPRVAPIQAVIVPISAGNWKETVLPRARRLHAELKAAGLRVHLDDRDAFTPGWKYADWEMRGVPVRIEIGPKDIDKQQAVLVSRLDRKKLFVPWGGLAAALSALLEEIQAGLYARALAFRDANTRDVRTYDELREAMAGGRGFIRCGWCGGRDCETKVKADTAATIRVILEPGSAGFDAAAADAAGACPACGRAAAHAVLFAKSY